MVFINNKSSADIDFFPPLLHRRWIRTCLIKDVSDKWSMTLLQYKSISRNAPCVANINQWRLRVQEQCTLFFSPYTDFIYINTISIERKTNTLENQTATNKWLALQYTGFILSGKGWYFKITRQLFRSQQSTACAFRRIMRHCNKQKSSLMSCWKETHNKCTKKIQILIKTIIFRAIGVLACLAVFLALK